MSVSTEQRRLSAPEITNLLQSAVWDLAYLSDLPQDQAHQLRHAARLMLAAAEQLVPAGDERQP